MSITLGDFKNRVLHKIREFSNAGTIVPEDRNLDYFLSMPAQINDELMVLTTSIKKIQKRHDITHYMPYNQLGRREWNEMQIHRDDDISFMALGSRAYSFQVGDSAVIYIEEEINSVWTILATINHTSATGQGYTSYKGKITASSTENNVRLRFSGDYFYPFRWVALFEENFETDDKVPDYQPYVPYVMPENFFELNKIVFTHPYEVNEEYSRYKYSKEDVDRIYLGFDWYETGEFSIYYYAYPDVIPDNATDEYVINLNDELIPLLILKVASLLQIDENTYMSEILAQDYAIAYNNLVETKQDNLSSELVHNVSNW